MKTSDKPLKKIYKKTRLCRICGREYGTDKGGETDRDCPKCLIKMTGKRWRWSE